MVRPTLLASSIRRKRFGTIAIAAPTSSPRLPALPSGLTKSFCTSTAISAAYLGSQRSFNVRKTSIADLHFHNRESTAEYRGLPSSIVHPPSSSSINDRVFFAARRDPSP